MEQFIVDLNTKTTKKQPVFVVEADVSDIPTIIDSIKVHGCEYELYDYLSDWTIDMIKDEVEKLNEAYKKDEGPEPEGDRIDRLYDNWKDRRDENEDK